MYVTSKGHWKKLRSPNWYEDKCHRCLSHPWELALNQHGSVDGCGATRTSGGHETKARSSHPSCWELVQKAWLPAGREGARQDVCVPAEGPAGLTRRKSQALQVPFILWFFFSKQYFWPQSELRLRFALLNFTNPAPRQTTFKSCASSARAANLRPARHPSCATCKAQAFSERPWESRGSTAGRPGGRVTCIYFGSPRGQLP